MPPRIGRLETFRRFVRFAWRLNRRALARLPRLPLIRERKRLRGIALAPCPNVSEDPVVPAYSLTQQVLLTPGYHLWTRVSIVWVLYKISSPLFTV